MIGGKGDTEIREYQLKQPKAPVRRFLPDENGQLQLIDEDWLPPVKKKRGGRERYRAGMLARSRSTFAGSDWG